MTFLLSSIITFHLEKTPQLLTGEQPTDAVERSGGQTPNFKFYFFPLGSSLNSKSGFVFNSVENTLNIHTLGTYQMRSSQSMVVEILENLRFSGVQEVRSMLRIILKPLFAFFALDICTKPMVVKAAGALAWINAVAPSYTSSHCIKTFPLLNTGPWVGIMYFCCTPKCHGFLKKRFLWNWSVNGLRSFSYRISFLLKNWQTMIIHFWISDRNFLKNKVSPLFPGKQLWQHLLPVTKSAPSFHHVLSLMRWWWY